MARPDRAKAGISVKKTMAFYSEQATEALIGAFARTEQVERLCKLGHSLGLDG